MKRRERPSRMRDLLEGRRRSVFDPSPAIEQLHRELEHVEILEQVTQEDGRIFPTVTKAYMPGRPTETAPDGSLLPVLVVRFPVPVEDREDWSKQCKAWQRPPSTIQLPDTGTVTHPDIEEPADHSVAARLYDASQIRIAGPLV